MCSQGDFLRKEKSRLIISKKKLQTKKLQKSHRRSKKELIHGEMDLPQTRRIMEEPIPIDGSDVPVFKNDAENISQRINTTFLDAVANIRNNKGLKVSNDKKLKMYGLFKQANIGPNKSGRPGMFDPVGGAKWDAWTACKAMNKREAKKITSSLSRQ